MHKEQSEKTIDQHIIDIVKKNHPKTVNELVMLLQPRYPLPEEEILKRILHLENQGKITLKNHQAPVTPVLGSYVFSTNASWYWAIIAVAAATAALVFTVPENAYPVVFTRYIFGAFFVLFLPGFALSKALFPMKGLNNIEQFALGTGISIALAPLVGLLLNFAPGGISTSATTFSLLALTVVLATTGLVREKERLSCPDYQDRW